jgi:hypothetical protein
MKTFDKEYENKFEQLKAAKKTFKEVLFLSAKEGLTETKENALISALANIDVDTTKDNLDEHELYNPQNEKKYVGVRKRKPKSDCPGYDMLKEQLPERLVESISTTIKQMSKRAITKRSGSEFTLEFNNQEMIKLVKKYSNKILDNYKSNPKKYTKECHSTMDVVNTYFDPKGRSKAKYRALSQDLEQYSEFENLSK